MDLLVLNWQDRENPLAGGAETHLHETFGRIAERGHSVTLVASGWVGAARSARLDGIDVHRVGSRYTYPLYVPGHVRHMGGSGRFDLIVEDLNKVPLFAPLWVRSRCILIVHHLFGSTGFRSANPVIASGTWLLERPIPWVYDEVPIIAVSQSTRDDLITRGLQADRIGVVENGVDSDRYSPGNPAERMEEPTILYLGRLKRYKRVDLILDAVARLWQDHVPVKLLIAGEGHDRARLERRARSLGLTSEKVEFLGLVSEAKKLRLLRGAWVHVFTSSKEGWGITNLEASACGTPVVASDSPGLRDSVVDTRTGLLVPHGDVEALAHAIRRLLADESLRRRMGEAGRDFATGLSWDRAADRLEELLARVVASGEIGN